MAKLIDLTDSITQRVIIYGGPKVGKTEIVGKLSEHFSLVWLDLENGYTTLRKLPRDWQARIELVSIPDTRSYPVAIETLLKILPGNKSSICDAHGKVACMTCKKGGASFTDVYLNALGPQEILVIDSLTQLANSAMANITKNQPDDYKYEWDDYRKQGTLMDKVLSYIQQARYNVVVITHEIEAELEDGKKKLVPAGGTTNFSRNVAKYFDHVIYAEVKNKRHVFGSSTTFGNSLVTGSRMDVEIEKAPEATLLDIFKPLLTADIAASSTVEKIVAEKSNVEQGNAAIRNLAGIVSKQEEQAATDTVSPEDAAAKARERIAQLRAGGVKS